MARISIILLIQILFFASQVWSQNQSVSEDEAFVLYKMGLNYMQRSDYAKASECLEQAYEKAPEMSQIKRKSMLFNGLSYFYAAAQLSMKAYYQNAYANYEKALISFTKIKDKKNILDAIKAMAGINGTYYEDYDLALDQYHKAYDLAVDLNNDSLKVGILSDMMKICDEQGEWAKKNSLSLQLDSIVKASPEQSMRVILYKSLGDGAKKNGQYKQAERFYIQALPYVQEGDKTTLFLIYQGIRDVSILLGEYKQAAEYGRKCEQLYARVFGNNSEQRYTIYNSLASIYAKLNDRKNCFSYADSLFKMMNYNINDLSKARLYSERAQFHFAFKEYKAADEDFTMALRLLGDDTNVAVLSERQRILGLQAGCLHYWGKNIESKKLYVQYAELAKSRKGGTSSDYADALGLLANIEGFTGEKADGSIHYQQAVELEMNIARRELRYLPSSAREKYWNGISTLMWNMSAYGVKSGFSQDDFTLASYNALLFSKGLLLSSEKSLESTVNTSGKKELIESYNNLLYFRKKVTDFEAKGNHHDADIAYAKMDSVDKELTQQLQLKGGLPFLDEVKYQNIVQALKPGEVLIDFTDYVPNKGRHAYFAYLLKREWQYPKLIKMFTGEQIDSLLQTVRGHYDRLYEPKPSNVLMNLLWKPLSEYAVKGKTVYFVPSGILNQLAIESIALNDGSRLGDRYDMVRLTSAKEILSFDKNRILSHVKSARLYGALEYDIDTKEMVELSKRYTLPSLYAMRGINALRGDSVFRKLTYSDEEVTEVGKILARQNIEVKILKGTFGTEESFMAMNSNAPDILLMSTHGFYYTPEAASKLKALSGYNDVMYLTGLVMSGGNAEWMGKKLPKGVYGGLLSSEDISHLDLSQTQLVVLSACETGLGKATNEGLYGLQRAFKKAGAQTMVLSLWPVSDYVTKDFMIAFYRNLVNDNWNKRKAFDTAKAEIRSQHSEPFYWAGFVMVD